MILKDIFDKLTYGELSSVALGGKDSGGIKPENYKEAIIHIEAGLNALYKRFPILTKEVIIQQYNQIQTYHLHSKHSWLTGTHRHKYIIDSDTHPFTDDALSIIAIYDELGREMWLNDTSQYWRVVMLSDLSFQIPFPDRDNSISVIYKANHIRIPTDTDPDKHDIDIPYTYLEPLLLYVGGRVLSSNSMDGTNEGMTYLARYEEACNRIIHDGLVITDNTIDSKFELRGWI